MRKSYMDQEARIVKKKPQSYYDALKRERLELQSKVASAQDADHAMPRVEATCSRCGDKFERRADRPTDKTCPFCLIGGFSI